MVRTLLIPVRLALSSFTSSWCILARQGNLIHKCNDYMGWRLVQKEELAHYLELQEQAKQRDHRKLGKELDLFVTSDLVGSGLPLFTPRGTVLREELTRYSNDLRQQYGFEKVWVPHITKTALYEKSGHQAKFGDELF